MEAPNTKDGLTFVNYIGRWSHDREPEGSPEEQIEKLFEMMTKFTLDPCFERYGNFVEEYPKLYRGGYDDCINLFGNFWDYSFVFRMETKDAKLVARFREAVAKNKATEDYQKAQIEEANHEAAWKAKMFPKSMDRENFERSFNGNV